MTIVLNVRSRRRDFSSNVADSDAFELTQAKKKKTIPTNSPDLFLNSLDMRVYSTMRTSELHVFQNGGSWSPILLSLSLSRYVCTREKCFLMPWRDVPLPILSHTFFWAHQQMSQALNSVSIFNAVWTKKMKNQMNLLFLFDCIGESSPISSANNTERSATSEWIISAGNIRPHSSNSNIGHTNNRNAVICPIPCNRLV